MDSWNLQNIRCWNIDGWWRLWSHWTPAGSNYSASELVNKLLCWVIYLYNVGWINSANNISWIGQTLWNMNLTSEQANIWISKIQHGFIACPVELSLPSLEDRFNLISHTGWVLLSAIWTSLTQARSFAYSHVQRLLFRSAWSSSQDLGMNINTTLKAGVGSRKAITKNSRNEAKGKQSSRVV